MATVTFQNGKSVNFQGTPTPQDVDFVAKQMGIGQQPAQPQGITQADIPAMQGFNSFAGQVHSAAQAGEAQAVGGYQKSMSANGNIPQFLGGVGEGLAGAFNTIASPFAPFMSKIGPAVNSIASAAAGGDPSDNPLVQRFAMSSAGQTASNVASGVQTADTVVGGVASAGLEASEAGPEFTSKTAPEAEAEVAPKLTPKAQNIVDNRTDALTQVERSNGPVRRVSNYAASKGVDVKGLVANTDLLHDSVDENGAIDTTSKGGALDQFREFMNQYESAVGDGLAREGKTMPLTEVEAAMKAQVDASHVAGAAKATLIRRVNSEVSGLELDADENGNIPLAKLQDAKISTTNTIDYTNPESKMNAKLIGNVYKNVIERNSNLPVGDVNAELGKYYTIQDYLESLNGKRVQGGRLGKYFAQTVGAIAGSHFGILGSIIGAELAGKIKGTMLSGTFGQEIGQGLEASDLLKSQAQQNTFPRIALPPPSGGAPIPLMPQSTPPTS